MKAETVAAFGSADMTIRPRLHDEAQNPGAAGNSRRGLRALANEPVAQDFALAMRRVEAECYDAL